MALFARAPLLCVALFAVAPLLCALDENEIKITLYIHQAWGGAAQNEVKVVQGFNNTRWGEIFVQDWLVRDGPGVSARVIGHAQGLQTLSSQKDDPRRWYMSMNLVFNDATRYSGSTLQILGFSSGPEREWSIVGGTGKLTMARGVAKYTFEKENVPPSSDIFKVNVHAYYSSMDSAAVYPKSGCNCNSKISEPIGEKTIA